MREIKRHTPRIPAGGLNLRAAAFLAAWQVFAHGPALAQPPKADQTSEVPALHRVLIITDDPNDPFMIRVQAEVSALPGLEITTQRPMGSLDVAARALHAEAAIRKVASGKGVEVWMADATSGRSLIRQLVVDESPKGPDHGLIALQTAELLRTGLRTKPNQPSEPPPSPPAVTVAPAPPVPPSLDNAVVVGIGPLWSKGGVGPALQAWLSYQYLWSDHFGLSLDVSAPLLRGSISGAEGSARVRAITAGAGLLARLHSQPARVTGTATLGMAFASITTKGEPSASYLGSSPTSHTGLGYFRLGVAWNPARWLGLGAAGLVGTTTSRARIQFANRGVGDWGALVAAGFLCGQIAW